jgi:hypothetical protein
MLSLKRSVSSHFCVICVSLEAALDDGDAQALLLRLQRRLQRPHAGCQLSNLALNVSKAKMRQF